MKPFHFTLEPLRVLRGQKERAAQQRYVQALAACDEAGRQLEQSVSELTTGWKVLGEELCTGIAAERLTCLHDWCKILEIRRNDREAAVNRARQNAEVLFQAMTTAIRDREALDKFHEKSRRLHDRERQREEQNNFDELAVQMSGASGPLQFAGQAS